MARKVALAIGVSQSGNLTFLPAARIGAEEFARWAELQGFEVVRLIDGNSEEITAGRIYDALDEVLRARDVERLFVFFAGHGNSKGLDVDYWLLSPGARNSNEHVNVAASIRNARRSGVPHIAIFSDACRTMAGKAQQGLEGSVVFPQGTSTTPIQLDQFYAAQAGHAAQEVVNDPDAVVDDESLEAAFGVFTRVLMDVLGGQDPDAIQGALIDGDEVHAVTAQSLTSVIQRDVSRMLLQIPGAANQIPDPRPASYIPNILSEISRAPAGTDDSAPTTSVWDGVLTDRDALDVPPPPPPSGAKVVVADASPPSPPPLPPDSSMDDEIERLFEAQGRDHFETQSGLTVVNSRVRWAAVAGIKDEDVFEEGGAYHVRGRNSQDRDRDGFYRASSAILELDDDIFSAAMMMAGFIGTISVGSNGVEYVGYLPAPDSDFIDSYENVTEARLRNVMARVSAIARRGRFELAAMEAQEIADELRAYKHVNPTLGVFAAYAYDMAGRTDQVDDMLTYYEMRQQPVPYDILQLSSFDVEDCPVPAATSFPLLTQGWAYLDPWVVDERVWEARSHLAPTLYATIIGDTARALGQAILNGEIR